MPPDRASPAFAFFDLHPPAHNFREEVLAGLGRAPKALPPKYFYDGRGAALFEAICETPEYYPTRTEVAVMRDHGAEMAGRLGPRCTVIEYGSGSGRKTRILLEAAAPSAYVPIDISKEQLRETAAGIAAEFPGTTVTAVCADYTRPLELPEGATPDGSRRIVYFPGSTIGNLDVEEAARFLRQARGLAGAGGGMLVGVDLKKETARLEAAYNDRLGHTARFNLNLLERINRELGADFDLDAFRHRAFYNESGGRIEMHLVSVKAQSVRIGDRQFEFRAGETIHTENSYKYSIDEFRALAQAAGFEAAGCWTDPERLFSVHYLAVGHGAGEGRQARRS